MPVELLIKSVKMNKRKSSLRGAFFAYITLLRVDIVVDNSAFHIRPRAEFGICGAEYLLDFDHRGRDFDFQHNLTDIKPLNARYGGLLRAKHPASEKLAQARGKCVGYDAES